MTIGWSLFRNAPVQTALIDGKTIAYRCIGDGPPIVMIHGWPLCGATYRGIIEQLHRSYTCIVPDLPGAGRSPSAPLGEFFAGAARLVVAMTEALSLERYALVGQDSGGTIARLVAAQAGSRVSSLVLFNTEIPGVVPPLVPWFQRAATLPGARMVFAWLLRIARYRRSALGFGGAFEDLGLVEGEFRDAIIAPLRENLAGALSTLRAADLGIVHRLGDVHARIQAPLLCIWGDRDPFFPTWGAKQIVETWPAPANLHIVPGKKLLVHEEAPEHVATVMTPFLCKHAYDGAA